MAVNIQSEQITDIIGEKVKHSFSSKIGKRAAVEYSLEGGREEGKKGDHGTGGERPNASAGPQSGPNG